ncbi:MAG TPA: phage holin family protein [Pyrinomonadaceae bacterium]|jgi:uncharacterized membrane protein YqjE|nr:phage holin family protein [Pyrinomonadaceae bacterium]
MAELERRTTAAAAAPTQADIEGLPALFGRLGDNVMALLDTKLSLVKVELKEDAAVYVRGGALIGVGVVLAVVGLALLNVAIAFFVSTLFSFDRPALNYALGFLITGIVYLVIGGIIVVLMKNRLAERDPVPNRSVEELKRDKQWLANEVTSPEPTKSIEASRTERISNG